MFTKNSITIISFALILYFTALTNLLHAQVYKCVDSNGNVLYSNSPCPQNTEEQNYKPRESFTINDETTDPEIEDLTETEQTSQNFGAGELDINIVQVRLSLPAQQITAIHKGVHFVYDYFKEVYGITPGTDINIKIFGRHGDFLAYQKMLIGKIYSESGIFSSRTGEALVNASKYRNEVVGISIHEACHAMIQQAGYRIPVWVNEGIAEYFETIEISDNQVLFRPQYDRHSEIASLLSKKELISLLEYFGLSNNVWKNRNLVEDRTSRSIAYSLVHYLMSSVEGTESIKKILKNFSVSDEPPSMFVVNQSYSGGLNLLEKNWHEYLTQTPSGHVFSTNQ